MRTNTNPTTLRARTLRQTANPAEQCLWNALKARQLGGYKFTRQFPVGSYFEDFACREHMLLVELDGSQHVGSGYDKRRDAHLLNEGYSVLRVPSVTVLQAREAVCESILAALEGRMEDLIEAPDLSFVRSHMMPRKYPRRKLWREAQEASRSRLRPAPTPSLPHKGEGKTQVTPSSVISL
jgi:very-short-patch-repair endonuclease